MLKLRLNMKDLTKLNLSARPMHKIRVKSILP